MERQEKESPVQNSHRNTARCKARKKAATARKGAAHPHFDALSYVRRAKRLRNYETLNIELAQNVVSLKRTIATAAYVRFSQKRATDKHVEIIAKNKKGWDERTVEREDDVEKSPNRSISRSCISTTYCIPQFALYIRPQDILKWLLYLNLKVRSADKRSREEAFCRFTCLYFALLVSKRKGQKILANAGK